MLKAAIPLVCVQSSLAGGVVTIRVTNIQELHDKLVRKGVNIGDGIMDQVWGDQEVYVRDLAGNKVRFQSA